jgi:hypothetical protein
MGGEREETVAVKGKGKSGEETVGNIRFHEKDGEVHFHDDANKLKVAVPVSVWWDAWNTVSGRRTDWDYIDLKRSTLLRVSQSVLGRSDTGQDELCDLHLTLEKVRIGNTYQALQRFTEGT